MSYGRHQSFYIKENWLNKFNLSVQRLGLDFINNNENYRELGIGKNMFAALKYWVEAFDLVRISRDRVCFTEFGSLVAKYDLAANQSFTKNILHYNLVSKKEDGEIFSHSFHYYFNYDSDSIIDKKKLLNSIAEWNDYELNNRTISENTIDRDIDCLIATYSNKTKKHPEDLNISLLADLGLVQRSGGVAYRSEIRPEKLTVEAIFYIIMKETKGDSISIDSLVNDPNNIGKIFHLSRIRIINILEGMIAQGYPFKLTRTNNLDTLLITERVDPYKILKESMEAFDEN